MDPKTLPDDPELLKAMVLQLAEERALLVSSNEKQAREIEQLKRKLFGKKSERSKAAVSDKPSRRWSRSVKNVESGSSSTNSVCISSGFSEACW